MPHPAALSPSRLGGRTQTSPHPQGRYQGQEQAMVQGGDGWRRGAETCGRKCMELKMRGRWQSWGPHVVCRPGKEDRQTVNVNGRTAPHLKGDMAPLSEQDLFRGMDFSSAQSGLILSTALCIQHVLPHLRGAPANLCFPSDGGRPLPCSQGTLQKAFSITSHGLQRRE